jgi:hypothetical protein
MRNRLGSLYFTESGIPRCEPAIITDGPPEVSDHIRSRFCIGPTVQREFWEKERSQMHEYQGPCMLTSLGSLHTLITVRRFGNRVPGIGC